MRRILSIFTVGALVLGVLLAPVWAQEEDDSDGSSTASTPSTSSTSASASAPRTSSVNPSVTPSATTASAVFSSSSNSNSNSTAPASSGTAAHKTPRQEIIISVAEQRLKIVEEGRAVASFRISSSKFGLGDDFKSYKTPLGQLEICSKMGDKLPLGAVIKGGRVTGEVLRPNAPGRDPIVTRIIRLQGLEKQNKHARTRGIYIHGTPEETRIGKPVSWGCIRMRSKDVVELYEQVSVGTKVTIVEKDDRTKGSDFPLVSWIKAAASKIL